MLSKANRECQAFDVGSGLHPQKCLSKISGLADTAAGGPDSGTQMVGPVQSVGTGARHLQPTAACIREEAGARPWAAAAGAALPSTGAGPYSPERCLAML